MANQTADTLKDLCIQVLASNQHGNYTLPTNNLYPHQWLWDSCFIAIGLANYDVRRAKKELISLLRGQWNNGMVPHMIFASGDAHKRDRYLWQSWRSPQAPASLATSGVTQPPMLAEAIIRVGRKMSTAERHQWYLTMYPALLRYHEWLYRERDPREEGLVLLVHPWEGGLDNTPPWISQLHRHQRPWWVSLVVNTRAVNLLFRLVRRDTLYIPPGQRVSNLDALLYYDVIRHLKHENWDINAVLSRSNLAVQDLSFNCILIRAHDHLKTIAKSIGHEVPDWLNDRNKKGRHNIEKLLFDDQEGQFYSRNYTSRKLIKKPSIATLMPLYGGCVSKAHAKRLVERLKAKRGFGTTYPVPTVPTDSAWYKELGYWQGPAWVNTNWLIIDGLGRYGYKAEAEELRQSTIAMVSVGGPAEYFSAKTAEPAGAHNFSWTAALVIDLLGN